MTTRFKDLCLDVADPARAAAFWGPVLGLTGEERGGNVRLGDGVDEHALWLNRVPEPKTVKHRAHLDVLASSVEDVVARGATVLDDRSFRWSVLADPEGGEFCVFVRDEAPTYRLYEVCVDAVDAASIARWWADRLGVEVETAPDQAFHWLPAAGGLPWELVFSDVPEPKRAKNRLHWDVWGDRDELVAAGATVVRSRSAESPWDWLTDPEGNEFCVFPAE